MPDFKGVKSNSLGFASFFFFASISIFPKVHWPQCFLDHLTPEPHPLIFHRKLPPIFLRKKEELSFHCLISTWLYHHMILLSSCPLPLKYNSLPFSQYPSMLTSSGQLPELFLFILESLSSYPPLGSSLFISSITPEVSSGLKLLSLPRASIFLFISMSGLL